MKIITWMVRIIVLLILVWLALQNNQTVVFSLMDGLQLSIPLIVLLLVFFAFGVILGLLILLPKYWGLKWDARKLRKENEQTNWFWRDKKSCWEIPPNSKLKQLSP